MNKISIIVPCYNEEDVLKIFYIKITEVSKTIDADFEYIFVDDGSKDKTLEILKEYSKKDNRVRFISFSRNFGKESAMYAGLKEATGDYVAIMDADLQDPPDLLKEMYETLLTKEFDCVATKRKTRKGEPILRSFFSRMFYSIINKMTSTEIVNGARDYRLMSRKMVDSILEVTEYNRFSKGIFSWVGFKTKWIAYDNIERAAGKTKWNFWKLFKYSIEGITAFTTTPLVMSAVIGIIFCILACSPDTFANSPASSDIYIYMFCISKPCPSKIPLKLLSALFPIGIKPFPSCDNCVINSVVPSPPKYVSYFVVV